MALVEVTIAIDTEDGEGEETLATIDLSKVSCFYASTELVAVLGKGLMPATVVLVQDTEGLLVLEPYADFKKRFYSVTN